MSRQAEKISRPLRLVLSGLTTSALEEWLAQIRRVAALEGCEALQETDSLLWSMSQAMMAREASPTPGFDHDWEIQLLEQQIDRVTQTCARIRELQAPALRIQDFTTLRSIAERLGELIDPDLRKRFNTRITSVRIEGLSTADAAERRYYAYAIRTAETQVIPNAAAAQGILSTVDRAVAALEQTGELSESLRQAVAAAKGRAARYRSERRRGEADVAEAGGNLRKAERLRAEAQMMLAQDLARAFPGAVAQAPPEVVEPLQSAQPE